MRRLDLLPAFLAAGATLAVCLPAQAASQSVRGAPASGLRGIVTRGPTQPVCQAEIPCSSPAPGVVVTFARGTATRRVRTDADGRYRIALAPGRYAIRIAGARFGFAPRVATVLPGRVVVRNISIDTGIR